jgi:predicted nucleotidyltransferase
LEIKKIALKISELEGVEGVILFGSVARGDYTKESDIDLLIIFKNKKREGIQNRITDIAIKEKIKLQPILKTLDEIKEADAHFMTNILQDAKILFLSEKIGKKLSDYLDFKPYTIFSYETTSLSAKERTKFYRSLFGAKWKKDGKEYSMKGLLDKLQGKQIGKAVIMVRAEDKRRIEEFLDLYAVEYKERHIFMKNV